MNKVFDTRYYYLTKLFCSMVGLWPYQAQNKKRVIRSCSIVILISFLPPQLKRLHQVWGKDMDTVCMCMPPIFTAFLCLSKILTFTFFKTEMKVLLRQIETEWKRTLSEEESKILEMYASKSRILCIAYATVMCNGLMCFILAPTISPMLDIVLPRNETRVRSLAFELDYGIDMQTYWFWLWLHTSVAGVLVIFNSIAADITFITFTIHVCYLFAIVKHKLEHITDSITERTAQSFENYDHNIVYNIYRYKEQRSTLDKQAIYRECVVSHKKAIKCAQLVHNIYMGSLFVGAGLNVITISITAVQLVSKMFRWTEMMMSTAFLLAVMLNMFFLSLIAQYILDHSLSIHESAYSGAWYNIPVERQKDIILILMRSRSPCQLTAGKLLVMSLENFCAIMQTSMSYFTVLASFR